MGRARPACSRPPGHTRSVSTYNSQGLVTDAYQQVYAGTDPLDPNRHLWTTTARTHYGVDTRGNITSSIQYKPTEDLLDPTSGITPDELNQNWTIALPHTSTAYDELGRVTDTLHPRCQGGTLHTQTYYNLDGQVWRSYDVRGNYSENEYDDLGQLIATHSYDAEDHLLFSTSTTYNANGQVITSTDALGNDHPELLRPGRPLRPHDLVPTGRHRKPSTMQLGRPRSPSTATCAQTTARRRSPCTMQAVRQPPAAASAANVPQRHPPQHHPDPDHASGLVTAEYGAWRRYSSPLT